MKISTSDLLVFYPQGGHLYIEFLGGKYIEVQPKTQDETAHLLEHLRPIVSQLDEFVEKHQLKEIMELNLKGVPISKLNSDTATHLINLLTDIRPDKGLLEKIYITNSNPVFNMIYRASKTRLPVNIQTLIEFKDDSKFF
jgi:hypothetical protein